MPFHVSRFAAAAIAAAALASASASSAPAGPIRNACDLIARAEIESVLDVPMREPEPQIMGMCEYRSVGDHPYKSVRLMLGRAESRQDWEQHERGIDPDVKPVPVPNAGDAALFWNRTMDARLAILKGKTTLTVILDVGKLQPALKDTLPVAQRLGQTAAARMP